jgi:inosine-uridine nucleoside N-ribohydrolase
MKECTMMVKLEKCLLGALALLTGLLAVMSAAVAHDDRPGGTFKLHKAQPIIWIGDFNNFDDAVALMLVAKDPRYRIELVVVEESFNTVAHGANMVYNILEWLGNRDTRVIRGAYHAVDEVALGANGAGAAGTQVTDGHAVPGRPDYQLPSSADATSGTWNLERRNVMGIGLYGQFIPGPWRDNGSTLYNTDHLIPRARQESYHYQANQGMAFDFQLAEDIILKRLENSRGKVVVLNTGKLTTFARVLGKGTPAQLQRIDKVVAMGGGFQGREPFTANHAAACFGDRTLNLGGNIFSHPSFGCATDFSTHQEFNIFLDPASAKLAFDLLSEKQIKAALIPTNATEDAKVQLASIDQLAARGATPEACYTSKLLAAIRRFEGGDFNGNGDFALNAVIRLWDIVAALVLLEPQLVATVEPWYVDVDQLDPGLAQSATPYDPISFDPKVGKTTLRAAGSGRKIDVVLGVQTDAARQAMIGRLRDRLNAAAYGPRCGPQD